ncbi:MAG: formyltetrahydrofolate deformylase [Bacillaceae bacterium]|nr:formyltetrahydrofolate deformylase [Bacillaceae bacterium]
MKQATEIKKLPQVVSRKNRGRVLISCPDRPGVVAAVSHFLYEHGANIVEADQHSTDPDAGRLFMRIEFDLDRLEDRMETLKKGFKGIASEFEMDWEFKRADDMKKTVIFVSREDHCLMELLWQWQSGALYTDIVAVISNHPDHQEKVEQLGIPFYHVPVTRDNKKEAEQRQLELLAQHEADLIVLARYMQILSPEFVSHYPNRIINIHHSFLPAFVGANPYRSAYNRGVKLIGATAHYVTDDLDQGPIIEQDVERVNHRYTVDDLRKTGRHIERIVLVRAVNWHLEDKIIPYQNKTVVFG